MESTSEYLWKGACAQANSISALGRRVRFVHRKKSIKQMIISQVFGLAWIVPIVILLTINFKGWIVGASVGCGFRKSKCDLDPFAPNAIAEAQKLDRDDHNILGALQIVAKALEVWFILISITLVYHLTMLLAVEEDGLPIGYLMLHREFLDILTLGRRVFWLSASSASRHGYRLYALVGFAALLTIIANLMGPAAAVLVLPTLGWSNLQFHDGGTFGVMAASGPPRDANVAAGCDISSLRAGNYNCTGSMYAASLDEWFASIFAGNSQAESDPNGGTGIMPASEQEGRVMFVLNITTEHELMFWVPNRHVLRQISDDYVPYWAATEQDLSLSNASAAADPYGRTLDMHQYLSYRNNLQALLHHEGPSLGLDPSGGCAAASVSTIQLSGGKGIRCYTYFPSEFGLECLRVGPGWNGVEAAQSQFSIGDASSDSAGSVTVNIYSTNRTISQPPQTVAACAKVLDTQVQDCPWDEWFADPPPDNYSLSHQLVEYNLPSVGGRNLTICCDNYAYLSLSDYQLDPSPLTNPTSFVYLDVLTNITSSPLYVHSDWTLAAWSVAKSGTVDGNRAAATYLLSALKGVVNTYNSTNGNYSYNDTTLTPLGLVFDYNNFAFVQALSMIDFTTTATTSQTPKNDPLHPIFRVYASLRVWAYGIDSRTSRLGITVALFGCCFVLLCSVLSLITRIQKRSTLELVVTALENEPEGAFERMESESEKGKVKFRIVAHEEGRPVYELHPHQEDGGIPLTRYNGCRAQQTGMHRVCCGRDF
jgi:hypothetical protein